MVTSVGISLPTVAQAAPPVEPVPAASKAPKEDNLPNPLADKQAELREQAITGVLKGEIKTEKRNGSVVAKVGSTNGEGLANRALATEESQDQYVELSNERTDKIFVILAEFGNERHPNYPDVDSDPTVPGPTTFEGPLHNSIPQPGAQDNSTVWQADYNQAHYQQLYFGEGDGVESLKTYYETQSSGRYSVDGEVTSWVKVPYNEARYGRDCDINGLCTDTNAWALVRDAANQYVADQKAAGRSDEDIAQEIREFDVYDRYDYDGDGDFNEPDGYIDHFQIVHAGGDESDGDPQQGEDAIWAHRWAAYLNTVGIDGPSYNKGGGTQIGNTGVWISDYTMQPENGGLSVFAHEYGHDLGLPDDYDTSGGTNNNSEFWTLMAQSRLSGAGEALGTRPGDIGAWNKLQLGWLDYEVVVAGKSKTLDLGPQEYNTSKAQGAVVVLPDKEVTTELGAPFAGTKQWFSGNQDDLNTSLATSVDLTGKTTAALDLKGRYDIEEAYDYLYFEVSENGTDWTAVDGTVDGQPIGTDGGDPGRPALDGSSNGAWQDIHIPLDAYAGKKIQVRLHYLTDGGVSAGGFFGDELTITADGTVVSTDGAEGTSVWTADGFSIVGASYSDAYDNFYIAGNRSYVSYDKYLKTGPYNFGWASTKPDYVEHFAYQQGLLISYWDTSVADNNVNVHPGSGRNLIIDSHPEPIYNLEGAAWRSRIQLYDAPFGTTKADSFTLHINGKSSYIRGQAANPLFDDTDQYFYDDIPWAGVKLPAVGVKIQVVSQSGTSMKVQIS